MMPLNQDTQAIHPRLLNLSYSSLLTLHACPRRFQLDKLQNTQEISRTSVTFAYGHAVGTGIQSILQGHTREEALWNMFLSWDTDLLEEETRSKKSFWEAVYAMEKFIVLYQSTDLHDYELASFNGVPAIELSFRIAALNSFVYRGFVDAVLMHRETGEVIVLEIKTTSLRNLDEAQYKNSSQALGYSVILDAVAPGRSSYRVLYLIYKSGEREFELMPFDKSYSSRANWIHDLIMDTDQILYYEEQGRYPTRGESCYSFFRQCEYFNLCTLPTDRLVNWETLTVPEEETFTINVSLVDLIDSQLLEGEIL